MPFTENTVYPQQLIEVFYVIYG